MRPIFAVIPALLLAGAAGSLVAQPAMEVPGKMDPARVTGGTYAADPGHTQILFSYSHLGFTQNMGLLSGATGTLMLDPKMPSAAKVSIDVPINTLHSTIAKLDEEFQSKMFFDAATFPTAHFESASVTVDGTKATIAGNLTIKGITKPAVIDATFEAAGTNPMSKKETIAFNGAATIKRSDFGLGLYAPLISDAVKLTITAAFEKAN